MLIVAPSCQERWRDSRRQASTPGEVRETMETGHYLTLWVHPPRPARLVCAREHQNWQICQRHPVLFTDRSRFLLTIPDRCERIWRCRGERAAAWSVIFSFDLELDSKSSPLWVNYLGFQWLNTSSNRTWRFSTGTFHRLPFGIWNKRSKCYLQFFWTGVICSILSLFLNRFPISLLSVCHSHTGVTPVPPYFSIWKNEWVLIFSSNIPLFLHAVRAIWEAFILQAICGCLIFMCVSN